MNRNQFLSKLAAELSKLPKEEIEAAMEFYTEYLDDAGKENEIEAIKSLGNPSNIAFQIKADFALRQIDNKDIDNKIDTKNTKKGISAIWWVIGGIFAAPIAIPTALAMAMVVIAILVSLVAVAISGILVVGAFIVVAMAIFGVGIVSLASVPSTAIMLIGIGISAMALGIISLGIIIIIAKWLFNKLIHMIHNINEKRIVRKMEKNKSDFFSRKSKLHEVDIDDKPVDKCEAYKEGTSDEK